MCGKVTDIKQHLIDRGIDFDKRGMYIRLDEENVAAYFMIYNLSTKLIGYQRYNPNGSKGINWSNVKEVTNKDLNLMKYYNYVIREADRTKHIAFYGVDTYDINRDVLYITEGIFDTNKLHNFDLPSIAVLCNDPKPYEHWFKSIPQKKVVFSDRGKAGLLLKKFGDYVVEIPEPYGDLGDMPHEEVGNLLKEHKII